jgi:hypothetical protein
MPGVRYGPDIADDAAAIYKGIKDLNDKEQALKRKAQAAKKSGKAVKSAQLNKKDQAKYDSIGPATEISCAVGYSQDSGNIYLQVNPQHF